ncbi:MAG TPA: xanthine dehydrogenase family protein molybdopterin-binding subunit [Candidatus Binatia bacterium]|jgi:carbon-monoxide dehydrogenase large subunit|nr:xanthine dehydrogenase family protein molybdopterin-binding subunit [Candidatus Binatia bacterium]
MTTEHTPSGLIGASIRRVEDPVLVAGKGCYTDDIQLPRMLHLAFLRSPYPHAKVISINTTAAKAMPGVEAVLTGAELGERLSVPAIPMVPGMKIPPHPLLARGAVHAAGTPVAAVVAESRAVAQDAASAIDVEYEALPAVTNAEKALEPGAPLAREELDTNICYIATKKGGDVEKAFAQADHIVRMHIASPRLVAMAIEPRGVVAKPEPTGDLTVWISTQSPHRVRADLATAISFPEHRIRVIAPDVGGGFGSKGPLYQEYALACHLALKLGRPVKWISTRSEDFVTTNQGRDQAMTSELALKRDGTMLGLKVRVVANLGAYLQSNTAGPPQRMMAMAPGCYQIQNCHVEVVAVFTNTVSTGPYRGAGRPESVLNIERLIDKAARDLGMDRLEIRRKNFIRPEQFPYRTGVNVEYDSGDYEKSLAEALRLSGYENLIRQRDEARARGELVGVGISTFVEPSGGAGFESGTVRVERTGEITVLTGSSSHGQGHETVFAQIAAEKMRVSMEHVAIRHGDTLAVQQGVGTFGSRSAVMGGGAMAIAIDRVVEKARRIAGNLVEAAPEDIVQADGGFAVAGVPEKKITWRQIAAAAYGRPVPGIEPGLQETVFFDPRREAWGFGAHVALVQIDRETGTPTLEKLVLVDDCGVIINPMIVEGQVHGGVAQGLGEAFREQMLYGDEGEVLTGSLMNYAVPRASDMPPLILGETVTPNPFNPLGVKGVGEAGCNGAPPAVANAVMDALAPLDIDHIDMPYTAPKLWEAIRAHQEKTKK